MNIGEAVIEFFEAVTQRMLITIIPQNENNIHAQCNKEPSIININESFSFSP